MSLININRLLRLYLVTLFSISSACSHNHKSEARLELEQMSKETLDELYQLQPNARIRIERSAGYAVFSNFGMRFFIAGGGSGEGLAFEVISGKSIPMKMVELQAGMGMGIKKFRLVWVFDDKANFNTFVNSGWELVGQYSALAKVSKTGLALEGAISVKPGVWLYQITNNGLSLELVVKGSKYYRNSSLN